MYLVSEGECHAHLKFDFSLASQIHIHDLEKVAKTLVNQNTTCPVFISSLRWLN